MRVLARSGAVRAGLALAALLLSAATAAAEAGVTLDNSRIAALEYGLACPLRIVGSEAAPGTENGRVDIFDGAPQFLDTGGVVPAALGISFGVRAWAQEGAPALSVTIRSLHPPFAGTGTSVQTFASSIAAGSPMTHIYTFDMPHEAAPGLWRLEAEAEGKLLYSVPFQVVPEAAYDGPLPACDTPPVLGRAPAPRNGGPA
ncbi:DUF3859 domain-containing protein [Vannielia litorea]|uniref:DUF3859 domain-containing protein n=1 Tax=Vannielia litorea TaxID=1217970 RepID=A0A1N6IMU2_9RHOB|nr:DUF3859 domain-containing protein [Vannielia litorea]SIO33287.1 protein of unknown function [Vannielia litorea]